MPQINPSGSDAGPNESLIAWAWEQNTHSSSSKFVLVCMAFHADENAVCYTDIVTLARETALSPKTIAGNLKRLCEDGFLLDARDRHTDSGRNVAYLVNSGGAR